MASQAIQPAPAYGSLAWLRDAIEAGKTEKSIHLIKVTPLIAGQLLQLNLRNRKIKPTKLIQYRNAMKAGLWQGANGETIKITADGLLGDGQHRLTAIYEEQIEVEMYIMFGATASDIETIDQGTARTAADVLRLSGGQHAPERAAIARMLIAYDASGGASIAKTSTVSNAESILRAETDQGIMTAAEWSQRQGRRAPGVPGSVIGLCYYILSAIHKDDCEAYLTQVCEGVNLKPRDAAMTVRDYLIRRVKKDKRSRIYKLEAILRGWNAYREQREYASVVTNGTLPELV